MARASTSARSRSVTISWSRSCGESSRRKKNATTTTPRHTSPEMMNWSCHGVRWVRVWVATRLAASAPMVGPERPESHGDAAAHLGREVAHQRRRRHEDDALDEPDHTVGGGEPPLVVDVGDGEELDERNDQRPVDREVGPADLVGEPADEGAEGADRVGRRPAGTGRTGTTCGSRAAAAASPPPPRSRGNRA